LNIGNRFRQKTKCGFCPCGKYNLDIDREFQKQMVLRLLLLVIFMQQFFTYFEKSVAATVTDVNFRKFWWDDDDLSPCPFFE
jgi:hypothetical protein